jgi:hypothetical protein
MTKHSGLLSFVLGLLGACGGTVDVGLGTGRLAVGAHTGSTDGGVSTTVSCGTLDDRTCQSTPDCVYVAGAPCGTRVPMSIVPSLNCSSLDDATCGQTSSCVVVPGSPCGSAVVLPGCGGLDELTCRTDPTCYYVWGLGCLSHDDPCSALNPSTCQSTVGCAYFVSIGCYSTPTGSPTDAGEE